MVQPNRLCLIVKLYINRPELLPDTHEYAIEEKPSNEDIVKDSVDFYCNTRAIGQAFYMAYGHTMVNPLTLGT